MKIGIVSMQQVINYGSFLQAYALRQLLKNNDVFFVNIYSQISTANRSIWEKNWLNEIKSIKRKKFEYLKSKYYRKKLRDAIIPFQNKYFEYDGGHFDLLIVGSDEVFNFSQKAPWNNKIFLGEGVSYTNICSFAASCGFTTVNTLDNITKDYISQRFKEFFSISVRDEGTYNFVRSLSDQEVSYILDPVLLYDFKKEILENTIDCFDDYMIIYSYNNRFSNLEEIKEIKDFARKYCLKIIAVEGYQYWTDRYIAVNPFQLFNLFDNAKYIVTDTFHGTIIASKMHKQFVTFIRDENSNKLADLMKRLCLQEHQYTIGNLEKILLYKDKFSQYKSVISNAQYKANEYINYIKASHILK